MKKDRLLKRRLRVRSKISGTKDCPRLVVSRTNRSIYAQLIDDLNAKTILGISSLGVQSKGKTKTQTSFLLGEEIAKAAIAKRIKKVVFDRSGYKYHGRVRAVAEGARKAGLKF
jgi:large subunit ribosomal protein L18